VWEWGYLIVLKRAEYGEMMIQLLVLLVQINCVVTDERVVRKLQDSVFSENSKVANCANYLMNYL
jgi:hypothetical protein